MMKLSVIIPCKNERHWIPVCLDALMKQKAEASPIDTIVVDNGSTDGTIDILASYGSKIRVFILPGVGISELRNYGAQQARGEWLAFVDADVEVRVDWHTNIVRTIHEMREAGYEPSKIVTGSTYLIPDSPSWVEDVWFKQLVARDQSQANYINGGNLVLTKQLFTEIGGFNPDYRTGEDVRLCQDAVKKGGRIVKVEKIAAIHHGYPKTLKAFFKRERWHGLGMKHYLLRPWQLKDLVLALYFLVVTASFIAFIPFVESVSFLTGMWFLALTVPILLLALSRSKGHPAILLPLTLLYFIYGWARVFSLFDMLWSTRSV